MWSGQVENLKHIELSTPRVPARTAAVGGILTCSGDLGVQEPDGRHIVVVNGFVSSGCLRHGPLEQEHLGGTSKAVVGWNTQSVNTTGVVETRVWTALGREDGVFLIGLNQVVGLQDSGTR